MKRLYYLIPVALILVFVWYFNSIIVYMILAAILSFLGRPVMKGLKSIRIKSWQFPNWLCALLGLVSVYGFFGLLFLSLVPVISQQGRTIARINPDEVVQSFREPIEKIQGWLEANQIQVAGLTQPEVQESPRAPLPPVVLVAVPGDTLRELAAVDTAMVAEPYRPALGELQSWMRASEAPKPKTGKSGFENFIKERILAVATSVQVPTILNGIGNFLGNLFVAIFSISFIAFFFLKESHLINQIIFTLTPSGYEERVEKVLDKLKPLLTRYFLGVLLEVLLVGGLLSLGFSILGIPNALFIGFFAGLLNVVPYVGPIVGGLLAVSFTTLASLDLGFSPELFYLLLKVIVVVGIVQLIDNLVFQPMIYSSSVKAHPLEIFLVILMAGTLAGPIGMIMAIPVYTIFRAVAQEFLSEFKIVKSMTRGI